MHPGPPNAARQLGQVLCPLESSPTLRQLPIRPTCVSTAAYKLVTAPEDWALAAPMTSFRMRHANGLAELAAQMERHFLAAAPQQALQAQQGQQNATGQLAALLHAYAPSPAGQAAGSQPAAAAPASPPSPPGAALLEALMAAPPVQEAAGPPGPDLTAASQVAAQQPAAEPAAGSSPAAEGPAPEAAEAGGPTGQAGSGEQGRQQRRFAAFTYLSQLQQGLAYQTAVHQWRRNKADPEAQVRRRGLRLRASGAPLRIF